VADEDSFREQIEGLHVADLVAGVASTLASLAYAKLAAHDGDEAKRAIDALASLVPHLEGEAKRDLGTALANLQVAWAESRADNSL
jgi:hypothetical protein